MKHLSLFATMLSAGLLASSTLLADQPAATNSAKTGPRLTFATTDHHFGRITSGEKVKYVYEFSNTGDQTLEVTGVKPGCHCTTAGDWTHKVEPGASGQIPIQFDSGSFRGVVHRTVTVTSNDKLKPTQTLSLDCTIWQAFEITPQYPRIEVLEDASSNFTTVVHIKSQSDEPVTLSNPTTDTAKFKAELKATKPGKEFELTLSALPPFAQGSTAGTVTVHTSVTNAPEIHVTVVAMQKAAVSKSPAQMFIPQQLIRPFTNAVMITGNSTKPLVLSDLKTTDPRIKLVLDNVAAGHLFKLTAVFPAGYDIAPGQNVEITVKTDHPKFPVLTIPVSQYGRRPGMLSQSHPKPVTPNRPPVPATGHP